MLLSNGFGNAPPNKKFTSNIHLKRVPFLQISCIFEHVLSVKAESKYNNKIYPSIKENENLYTMNSTQLTYVKPKFFKEINKISVEQQLHVTEFEGDSADDIFDSYVQNNILYEYDNLDITIFKNNKNRGPGFSRNVGIQWAKKNKIPFIMFADADDYFLNFDFWDKISDEEKTYNQYFVLID